MLLVHMMHENLESCWSDHSSLYKGVTFLCTLPCWLGGHPEQVTGWSKQYYCTGMRLVNLHHTTMQPMMDTHFLAHHKPAEEETTIQVSQCVTIYKNVDSSKLKRNLKIHIVFLPLGFLTNTTQHSRLPPALLPHHRQVGYNKTLHCNFQSMFLQ